MTNGLHQSRSPFNSTAAWQDHGARATTSLPYLIESLYQVTINWTKIGPSWSSRSLTAGVPNYISPHHDALTLIYRIEYNFKPAELIRNRSHNNARVKLCRSCEVFWASPSPQLSSQAWMKWKIPEIIYSTRLCLSPRSKISGACAGSGQ